MTFELQKVLFAVKDNLGVGEFGKDIGRV